MGYRWAIGFVGDVGGFGIGDAARFSWQAAGEVGFRVSRRTTIIGGYRILDYDTVEGDGQERNGTDLRQNGPIIGVGIRL
jgi:opacity protein-like surface antigen